MTLITNNNATNCNIGVLFASDRVSSVWGTANCGIGMLFIEGEIFIDDWEPSVSSLELTVLVGIAQPSAYS